MCLLDSVWIFRWEDWNVPGCDLARGSWSDWGGGSTPRMTALLVLCLGWAGVKAQLPWGRWLEDSTRTSSPQSWAFHSMAVSRDWVLQTRREMAERLLLSSAQKSVSLLPHSVGYESVILSARCGSERRRIELYFLRGEWQGHTAEEHVGWEMWPFLENTVCQNVHFLRAEGKIKPHLQPFWWLATNFKGIRNGEMVT